MRKKTLFICCFLLISFSGISQANNSETVDDQNSELIEKYNTYQSYKVIELNKLRVLQRNNRDSISILKTSIATSESVILEQNNKIDSITNQIEDLILDLAKTQDKVENISLLGIPTNKSTYNTIMWSIVIVLLLISSILFFRFKKSHGDTKDARETQEDTEVDIENLSKRSLEREQKVRRQLQDKINKNKLRRE